VAEFADQDFDSDQGRDRIFRTALGSAAFPALFTPVDVPGVGLCVDGGAVNNTPIKHAIKGGAERIIVVTPEPMKIPAPEPLGGVNLISQLAELLINERLYRDLHDAGSVNGYLRQLDALALGGVSPDAIQKVKDVFGWAPLEVVQIRPPELLDGSVFSAFSSAAQMKGYIEAGREAASRVLGTLNG
jgi:NTE family protein